MNANRRALYKLFKALPDKDRRLPLAIRSSARQVVFGGGAAEQAVIDVFNDPVPPDEWVRGHRRDGKTLDPDREPSDVRRVQLLGIGITRWTL